jgi:hypothetical protein
MDFVNKIGWKEDESVELKTWDNSKGKIDECKKWRATLVTSLSGVFL